MLNRLVSIFLESAEMRVKERKDLTVEFWRKNVDSLLAYQGKDILTGKGSISNEQVESWVSGVYEQFNERRKHYDALKADEEDFKELEAWVDTAR